MKVSTNLFFGFQGNVLEATGLAWRKRTIPSS
jgi:hypothetical protein